MPFRATQEHFPSTFDDDLCSGDLLEEFKARTADTFSVLKYKITEKVCSLNMHVSSEIQ